MIPILDTHQHLIYLDKSPYSWTKGSSHLAGRNFRYEEYLHETEGTGINRTIFMETSPDNWREEVGWIYPLVESKGSLIGGVIANCRPEAEGFEAYLESIAHPKRVGLRRTCHTAPDELSQQPQFVENIKLLSRYDLTFDLCFSARQLPLATELARKCPEVQFVLDHCGGAGHRCRALDPWREYIRQLAHLPNVACKISGVLTACKPDNVGTEAVRPYVNHCLDCFGPDRVVWGGDWPVCIRATTLKQWVTTTREIVKEASEADQHKLFHENAARIYKLEGSP